MGAIARRQEGETEGGGWNFLPKVAGLVVGNPGEDASF